jgi:hypothetical protein
VQCGGIDAVLAAVRCAQSYAPAQNMACYALKNISCGGMYLRARVAESGALAEVVRMLERHRH